MVDIVSRCSIQKLFPTDNKNKAYCAKQRLSGRALRRPTYKKRKLYLSKMTIAVNVNM